jgi:hypothetical protein
LDERIASNEQPPVPSVALKELLARFLLQRRYLRENRTVRPEAFMPHPYPDLSVTRHGNLSERQLWQIGRSIADAIPKKLHGRVDVAAGVFIEQKLRILVAPTPENPNHVNIVDWPAEKSAQKIVAQEISAKTTRVAVV